jgi:hypothetical protein
MSFEDGQVIVNDPFKKVSPAALIALKEALAVIYWYKKYIRSFIYYTIKNDAIVSTIDWQGPICTMTTC